VFGRRTAKKSEPETVEQADVRPGAKGRPTPKRSEAEKARKQRMTAPRSRREASALQRERMRAEREKRMKGMKSGDDRYLPARDRGPVRRFVRDFIDARRGAGEFLLPLLVLILLLSFLGESMVWARSATATLWLLMIVLTTMDTVLLQWRLGRALKQRFPDTSTKGAKFYGLLRSTQLRFLRMPKPQVKPGAQLPTRY
jgi:TRAP-type uncharacterized transport system fused permease subunit